MDSNNQRTVFISYRRSVSSFIARAIFDDLVQHDYDVFMDAACLNTGELAAVRLNQIAARAHFLVILTPGTVEHFTQPDDFLRQEIEQALRLERDIVPVLVNNFRFDAYASCFTGELARLPHLNGVALDHEYFDEGMQRLRNRLLAGGATGPLESPSVEERAIVEAQLQQIASQPVPTPQQLTAETLFMRGLDRFGQGDYASAVEMFDRCLRAFPNFAPAYVMRGSAKSRQEDTQGAINDLVQYLSMKDQHEFISRAGVVQMLRSLKDKKHQTLSEPSH